MGRYFKKLRVKELSLVNRAANGEEFLLYKSDDNPNSSDGNKDHQANTSTKKVNLEASAEILHSDLETLALLCENLQNQVERMLSRVVDHPGYGYPPEHAKKKYPYPYPYEKPEDKDKKEKKNDETHASDKPEAQQSQEQGQQQDHAAMAAIMEQLKDLQKCVADMTPENILKEIIKK
jgi:hypothetical protein